MAIDERRRLELADAAKRTLGDEAGLTLMEMLPPVGWADVATKQDLAALEGRIDLRFDGFDSKLDALEQRVDVKLDALYQRVSSDFRGEVVALTWRYIGAMGALFVAFSALMTLVIKL